MLDDDDFPVERDRPGYQDWYFFAYGRNYQQALRDLRLLTGPAPLPTHRSLGIIFSRWPAFSESEVRDMLRDFAAHGYPLSTLVMDMEWHKEGWGHWDANPDLLPDPRRFFELCHQHGLEVTFNDHPLDVREDDSHFDAYVQQAGPRVEIRPRPYNDKTVRMARVDVCHKQQNAAFCRVCHTPWMEQGLDYWWNDGSRGQMRQTAGQLVANKTFFEESQRGGRRGMLLARYGGIGSHRYGAFFTGDASSDWDVLRLQVEFNIRAGGVGVGHVSHDIGGFMLPRSQVQRNAAGKDIIDPVRYLRWLQFGVLGPILRFHSAPGCGSRLPYDYDDNIGAACRHWLRFRHSLMPYLYTVARAYHDTGVPPVRGLFLDWPDDDHCYRWDQYMLGPALLVAPVTSPESQRSLYLPAGQWYEFESGQLLDGGRELTREVALHEVPLYVRAGSIIPRQDPDGDIHAGHIADLQLDVYPGAPGAPGEGAVGELYEDDGRSTQYLGGGFCRTRFRLEHDGNERTVQSEVIEGTPLGPARRITTLFRNKT